MQRNAVAVDLCRRLRTPEALNAALRIANNFGRNNVAAVISDIIDAQREAQLATEEAAFEYAQQQGAAGGGLQYEEPYGERYDASEMDEMDCGGQTQAQGQAQGQGSSYPAAHQPGAIRSAGWTVDCGLWTVDCGLWTVDGGLWPVDSGL